MLATRFIPLTWLMLTVSFLILVPHVLLAATDSFISVGDMSVARIGHQATLLQDGRVLITGGDNSANTAPYLDSAEIYDPATGTFSPTGSMNQGRSAHQATLLPEGKVLISGGRDKWVGGAWLNSAEIYDPATGTFSPTGNLIAARGWHRAVLLDNGKVLVVGGNNTITNTVFLGSAELYDPTTGTFSSTGGMNVPRIWFAITKLNDGKVLTAGGSQVYNGWTNTTEIYDPVTGTFSSSGSLSQARWIHTSTLMNNNKVLYAGGNVPGDTSTNSVEAYDVNTETVSTSGNLAVAKAGSSQSLLPTGEVLIAGGHNGNYVATAEKYNPDTGTISYTTVPMLEPRYLHEATLLNDGTILFTGGNTNGPVSLASAEIYTVGNQAPVLSPIGNKTVNENETLTFIVSAIDPDGNNLTYSTDNLPAGSSFNPATQEFFWTPGYSDAGNYVDIEFTVTDDGVPMELDVELITITVGDVNRSPVITGTSSQTVLETETLTFNISASDPDGDQVTLSATNTPAGSSFNPATREFSWTPTLAQEGSYVVTFVATDDGTPLESAFFGVTITVGDNPTPQEQAENLLEDVVGADFQINIANSYLANLKKVEKFIEEGKIQPAINQLLVFTDKLNDDYESDTFDENEGLYNDLLAAVTNLINNLQN